MGRRWGTRASRVYYRNLEFFVWDKPTKEGIRSAKPLKPDLASVLKTDEGAMLSVLFEIFWSPPKDEPKMEIPVEVKDSRKPLVL